MDLREASRYLLMLASMGFSQQQSLRLVAEKFSLRKEEILLLKRVIRWPDESLRNALKKIPPFLAGGRSISVDGFNVLITVEEILLGNPVYLSTDGFIRDARAAYSSYRPGAMTEEAIREIIRELIGIGAGYVEIIFDSPHPGSGMLSSTVRDIMAEMGVEWSCRAEKDADSVVARGEISASSDISVIEKAKAVLDIPELVARRRNAEVRIIW
ncbi:MAG: DUF5616 domain-containing protein [Candidatus Methanodesulfokora sp.]